VRLLISVSMDVETWLVDLGSLAIRNIQILGYFPVSVSKTKETLKYLSFQAISFVGAYSFLMLMISGGWDILYLINLRSYLRFIKVYGPTERYAHHAYVFATSTFGLFFRTVGFWDAQSSVLFWKQNCSTLERVQELLGYVNDELLIEKNEFLKIKKNIKWSTFFLLGIICIHLIIVHCRRLLYSLLDDKPGWTDDLEFHLGSGFWACLSLIHVMYSFWICFFVQLYGASFAVLEKRIRNVNEKYEFPGVIYVSEIIGFNKVGPLNAGNSKSQHFHVHSVGSSNMNASLDVQLNRCVDAFSCLEKQVFAFNSFFGRKLIVEMIMCITNLVVHSFFATLWIGRGNLLQAAQIIVPFTVFAFQLYNFGTIAGRMTLAAQSVATAIFEGVPFKKLGSETRQRVIKQSNELEQSIV
jgi:hypothetical protein